MSANGKPYRLAVRAAILNREHHCLLVHRSRTCGNFAGCWEWPGGKVDPGEEFGSALVREAKEETSLDIQITGFIGATCFEMAAVHVVSICMSAQAIGGEIRLSQEHDQFAWVPLREFHTWQLPEHLRPLMLEYAQSERGSTGS
jgi:8-oxo-dGTP diphosphatase